MAGNLVVGQKLWFVPNRWRGDPEEVTVEKIGRKWAVISNRHRISIETLAADGDGYSSPGTCYLSKEEHDKEIELANEWTKFRRLIDRQHSCKVTLAEIKQAMEILKLESGDAKHD